MMAKRGRTQLDAAKKFGISQGAISCTKAREDAAILFCEKMPSEVEKTRRILVGNPMQSAKGVAYKLGIPEPDARSILLGINVRKIRDDAQFKESGAYMPDVPEGVSAGSKYGYKEGRREAFAEAARIAEMVGGEHGAAIAAAIRSAEA